MGGNLANNIRSYQIHKQHKVSPGSAFRLASGGGGGDNQLEAKKDSQHLIASHLNHFDPDFQPAGLSSSAAIDQRLQQAHHKPSEPRGPPNRSRPNGLAG